MCRSFDRTAHGDAGPEPVAYERAKEKKAHDVKVFGTSYYPPMVFPRSF